MADVRRNLWRREQDTSDDYNWIVLWIRSEQNNSQRKQDKPAERLVLRHDHGDTAQPVHGRWGRERLRLRLRRRRLNRGL